MIFFGQDITLVISLTYCEIYHQPQTLELRTMHWELWIMDYRLTALPHPYHLQRHRHQYNRHA